MGSPHGGSLEQHLGRGHPVGADQAGDATDRALDVPVDLIRGEPDEGPRGLGHETEEVDVRHRQILSNPSSSIVGPWSWEYRGILALLGHPRSLHPAAAAVG